MNVVQGMLGGQRSFPREFYIDGVTYLSSGSDFVTQGPCILYSGHFTQVCAVQFIFILSDKISLCTFFKMDGYIWS